MLLVILILEQYTVSSPHASLQVPNSMEWYKYIVVKNGFNCMG